MVFNSSTITMMHGPINIREFVALSRNIKLLNKQIWKTQSPFYLYNIYFSIILRSINRSSKRSVLFFWFPPTRPLFAVLFTAMRALCCKLKHFANLSSYIMEFRRKNIKIFNTVNLSALTEISTPFELSYLWTMYMLLMNLGFLL